MLAVIASKECMTELFKNLIPLDSCEFFSEVDIRRITPILKNAIHYNRIIVDISMFSNNDEEILQELYSLRVATSTPILVIVRGKLRGDGFLTRLVEMKLYNFVNGIDEALAQKQARECLAGRSVEEVAQYLSPASVTQEKKSWFSGLIPKKREAITTIGVAGVLSRIGTTTQALRLTCYLSQQNKAACYLEANNSGHIALLGQIYSESKQDESGLLRYGGIAMLSSLAPELLSSYTIRVIDCGTCYSGELFLSCQIQLIIGGSAPWELAALAPALESPRENRFYIFSLTSDCERQDILSFMGERFKTTLFAEYSPELFSELTQKEKEMYKKIEI